jgi:hypothetical protein
MNILKLLNRSQRILPNLARYAASLNLTIKSYSTLLGTQSCRKFQIDEQDYLSEIKVNKEKYTNSKRKLRPDNGGLYLFVAVLIGIFKYVKRAECETNEYKFFTEKRKYH